MSRSLPWASMSPNEKGAAVKELVATGASYRQIADSLGAGTAGSIAGVVSRLRKIGELPPAPTKQETGAISGTLSRVKAKVRQDSLAGLNAANIANKAESRKSDPVLAIDRAFAFGPLPGAVPVAFALNSGCRWPVDGLDGHGLLACGADKEPEHTYCAAHRQFAYLPIPPREKAALKAAERLS